MMIKVWLYSIFLVISSPVIFADKFANPTVLIQNLMDESDELLKDSQIIKTVNQYNLIKEMQISIKKFEFKQAYKTLQYIIAIDQSKNPTLLSLKQRLEWLL